MNPNTFIQEPIERKDASRLTSLAKLLVLVLAFVAMNILSLNILAQTTTSTIEGTVKDPNGAFVAGAQVKASGSTLATERSVITDAEGFYRIVSLPAGTYTLTVTQTGFATAASKIELTLNRTANIDVQLSVGGVGGDVVNVNDELPLLTTDTAATGATITPQQIKDIPVNGRNYLDLLQLVPGTAINRQADPDGDNSNPVLGERSGNNNFFIDGHPNKDSVDGGPAAQFNQETIAEFQVLTSGYKAEFGQASGAVVNVITKSGGNAFHGLGSLFLRNEAFDSSNSLDPTKTDPPHLRRFDYSLALGGPIIKDKIFFFGSAQRINENRHIDFNYLNLGNPTLNQLIRDLESSFDVLTPTRETRLFLKLNEQFGNHSLSQEVNYTNGYVRNYAPLSAGNSLPSTRTDRGARNLLLAFGDTMLLGDKGNPWILTLRGGFRDESADKQPSHPTGGGTLLTPYPEPVTQALQVPGPFGSASIGNNTALAFLDQKYTTFNTIVNKRFGSNHDIKFGWNFLKTKVDGIDARTFANQLFATIPDILSFELAVSGPRLLLETGGVTPADDEIHLNNNSNALFVQDDWRLRNNLTLSLGLRWENDSEFEAKRNFAPRVGVTWGIDQKTVVRAQLGVFYDQFRLGIARNVPQLGGANHRTGQVLIFPRGLYGSPNFISSAGLLLLGSGPCFSNFSNPGGNNSTDAQITSAGRTCPVRSGQAFIGVDRLNNVVAPGHASIPANSVITIQNIQTLSGLTPEQYISQINTAVGFPGFFAWGAGGFLVNSIVPPAGAPDLLENMDETPNTLGFSVGIQRELGKDMMIEADYHHREMRNLLGVRITNLAFRARVLGRQFDPPGASSIIGFGPYYQGKYDALVVNFSKRFSHRFLVGASYSYAMAFDNSRGVNLTPSDNFIGIVPEVTDPGRVATSTTLLCPSQNNRNGSFTACNGNFVAAAGTFLNGPDLDKGASDLSLDHVFQTNGMVSLPWKFQISSVFRVQSGFHHSKQSVGLVDPDGDGNTNGIDTRTAKRNGFTSPAFVNLDFRVSKHFDFGDRIKVDLFYEMFNVFNRQNPAAVELNPASVLRTFGTTSQVLPGREGQIGFRFEF